MHNLVCLGWQQQFPFVGKWRMVVPVERVALAVCHGLLYHNTIYKLFWSYMQPFHKLGRFNLLGLHINIKIPWWKYCSPCMKKSICIYENIHLVYEKGFSACLAYRRPCPSVGWPGPPPLPDETICSAKWRMAHSHWLPWKRHSLLCLKITLPFLGWIKAGPAYCGCVSVWNWRLATSSSPRWSLLYKVKECPAHSHSREEA